MRDNALLTIKNYNAFRETSEGVEKIREFICRQYLYSSLIPRGFQLCNDAFRLEEKHPTQKKQRRVAI
jgi:hypothetical protein